MHFMFWDFVSIDVFIKSCTNILLILIAAEMHSNPKLQSKGKYMQCPLGACHGNGKERRLRDIPTKLFELPLSESSAIIEEFQIPKNITKCCSICLIKIRKCLNYLLVDIKLSEMEINTMKQFLSDNGPMWNQLADLLKKPVKAIKSYYIHNKKRYSFEACLGEFHKSHPNADIRIEISDDDDTDVSNSSSDERDVNSDTASAESPSCQPSNSVTKENFTIEEQFVATTKKSKIPPENDMLIPPLNQPPKRSKTQDEYDSSATETADEENDVSPAGRHSPKLNFQYGGISNGPKDSVRDIIGNVIEKAIKDKSTGLPPPPAKQMLDYRSDVNSTKDIKLDSKKSYITATPHDKVMITGLVHTSPSAAVTITTNKSMNQLRVPTNNDTLYRSSPIVGPLENEMTKESGAYSKSDVDFQTLDLSIKKYNKDQSFVIKPMSQINTSAYKSEAIQIEPMHLHQSGQSGKEGGFYCQETITLDNVPSPPINAPGTAFNVRNQGQLNLNSVHSQQKLKQQKPSPNILQQQQPFGVSTKGSITQGTPLNQPQGLSTATSRYENVFCQTPPNSEKIGSITQGTPLSSPSPQNVEKRLYDYYGKSSRQSPHLQQQSSSQQASIFTASIGKPQYVEHPQLSSKQIIINDYITSQQMIGQQNRSSRNEKEAIGQRTIHMPASTYYYPEKDRSRSEYLTRTSPADMGR